MAKLKKRKRNGNRISVVVSAKDEEGNIKDCLKSVDWVDEVVLVDNGSTDDTAKIAGKMGAEVVEVAGGSYSSRKNKGAERASGEWLLFLDADERVTPKLRKEMEGIVKNSDNLASAFAVPRRNIILGKEMKHGGWWPDYVIRFFKKDSFVAWEGKLHEQPKFEGKLKHLVNPLIHQKHDNLEDMVDKTMRWSDIEARLMFEANHPKMNIPRFISAMCREFWLRMVRHAAFLDGTKGIIYALYQVWSRFISYAKLWELQNRENTA
jgi:glycosyltransferase involved in cell wall biosynthesis